MCYLGFEYEINFIHYFIFFSPHLLAATFVCEESKVQRLNYPNDSLGWEIDSGSDGIVGATLTFNSVMNSLSVTEVMLIIPGNTTADYMFPLFIGKSSNEEAYTYFYIPEGSLNTIYLQIKYENTEANCTDEVVFYKVNYID